MFKNLEEATPSSCWCKARPNEMVFVLLERDEDAPGTIRDWIARRIKSGKNKPGDQKLVDAEHTAQYMERQQAYAREMYTLLIGGKTQQCPES